ncbi:MAG: hypothetical protein J5806_05715 [Lentisphaeria bacterium]|nr:hypothetical protein [Lentisphaeria bacterium]
MKAGRIVVCSLLLFLTGGCCTISTVGKYFWCQSENRTGNRKFKFDPETRQLEFTGTETEIFYCFPFDFWRTIPCWKTVRHHHLTYPVGIDTLPPGSARRYYRIVFTDKARRFEVEKTGLPYLPYSQIRFSGGRPPDWREIAAREKEFLRIHPEDRKYLSGPFELREIGFPKLLIPAGRKDDRYCFYLPDENDLLLKPSRIESHPAVVWRAVWVVPSIAVDLVFWPVELIYLAYKGI